jgi:shikimate kinase
MAEIIEFIGPPGAGKSTVYDGLVNKWKRKNCWAPMHQFLPVKRNAESGKKNFLELQVRRLLGKPALNLRKFNHSAYEFLGENPKFVTICWEMIDDNRRKDHNGIDSRFRSAYYLFSVFGYYQALKHSIDPRICVTDELLVQRIIQITKEIPDNDDISMFAESVPLPRAIIYFDAPAGVLAERISNRERKILRHKNLEAHRLTELCIEDRSRFINVANLLQKRGASILIVNTQENTINECVGIILDFLNNLS